MTALPVTAISGPSPNLSDEPRVLLKPGKIVLKGRNRQQFERPLQLRRGRLRCYGQVTAGRREWEQHQQQHLATLASQALPRIVRLWWPDSTQSMRDRGAFRQLLRPACP